MLRCVTLPNLPHPRFLEDVKPPLRFGTSGLRGLVVEMTDLEVYVNVRGFLTYLARRDTPPKQVALAEDLRIQDPKSGLSSSPRIARAAAAAIRDAGAEVRYLGRIPTPALAYFALHGADAPMPGLMVTGSHIPADRNGVKFYRPDGEVLKSDEAGILEEVSQVRAEEYAKTREQTPFDSQGMFREPVTPSPELPRGRQGYIDRYVAPFAGRTPLQGVRLVLYAHSAVGRDITQEIFEALGAEVHAEGRTDAFVAVDTEDVSEHDERRYAELVAQHRADALLSTDGDGDRPLVVDGRGRFIRGDVLGALVAEYLGADFAAIPVSCSDAVDRHLASVGKIRLVKTRIGSPYVIDALRAAGAEGCARAMGWEANGGFLLASETALGGEGEGRLAPLPTRDAVLPMLAVLLAAGSPGGAATAKGSVAELVDRLPARYTRAGLLDAIDPAESRAILAWFGADASTNEVRFDREDASDPAARAQNVALSAHIAKVFRADRGFGAPSWVNYVDGVRIGFENGDIAHLRPSGNAPQLRLYAVADDQARADAIVREGIRPSGGILSELRQIVGGGA